jgi:hypothetical protein
MSQFSRKPRSASEALVFDGELLGQIEQTQRTLRAAQAAERVNPGGLDAAAPRIQRDLDELLQRAADEAEIYMVIALPGEKFDDIKRQHPPSEEQMASYREQVKTVPWTVPPEMNPATMGADLLVACLVEPKMSEDEIRDMWRQLSKGEQNQLWNLALGVQVEGASLPLSRAATATTGAGGEPSTTPPSGESPSPSS